MSTYNTLIGHALEERYRIERELTGGGQADVYTGTDTDSGIVRAIKLLPATFKTPPKAIERFKQESLLLTNLPGHGNVVTVFDGGYDPAQHAFYIIMEYVDGVTLSDFIDARADGREKTELHMVEEDDEATGIHTIEGEEGARLCTPPVAVAIVRRVADGLGHAHRFNITHRDVKPGNILISRDGDVKLADFGIARLSADSGLTMTGTAIGTLHYMSPEQIQGRDLDGRSDIYSLGVVLYECLVGRTPFGKASRDMVPYHIINTAPTPPAELDSDIPLPLQDVVMRALAKSPADRYATMAEFEGALAGLVAAGVVAEVDGKQIAAGVAHLRSDLDGVMVEMPERLDSDDRCAACGAPLPVGWRGNLDQCPGCAAAPVEATPRPNAWVHDLIGRAREKKNIRGKVGFELAKYIYSEELQEPSFQAWRSGTAEAEPLIQKGTVIMPAPLLPSGQPPEDDLLAVARRLMEIADYLTDPELAEYNHRLPEIDENKALATHARAKAYQVLGRRHTLRGTAEQDPATATKSYENARDAFALAAEQYQLAAHAWHSYEKGQPLERIGGYYAPVEQETHQRRLWATMARLLAEGILRFPHRDDRDEAYGYFRQAAEIGAELQISPGIGRDLQVAEQYHGYYENALAELEKHLAAIADAQTSARAAIAAAQTADAALLADDRGRMDEWMRERAAVALDYFQRREDLPQQMRRVRLIARVAGYLLLIYLALAFVGETRGGDAGPFWPGWPQLLARSSGYDLNFGGWHYFLVMLAGIDLLIFWPFNLLAGRQAAGAGRPRSRRPVIPTLSWLLDPLVAGLEAYGRRGPNAPVAPAAPPVVVAPPADAPPADAAQPVDAAPPPAPPADAPPDAPAEPTLPAPPPAAAPAALVALARFLAFIAPWVPVLLLYWALRGFGDLPGNYDRWLMALVVLPAAAGYFVGRRLRRLGDKLNRVEADEADAHDALDQRVWLEREGIRAGRAQQAQAAHDAFGRANAEYVAHRGSIKTILQVLLARLLYYKTEADFVDLPKEEQTLLDWRAAVDHAFLRPMGLRYEDSQTAAVAGAEWRSERPLNTLHVTTKSRQIPLRIVHDTDGYLLWGIDGFQECHRQRLQREADGYSAALKLPSPARQVNFTFETADHQWPGQTHTIWLEGNRAG